MVKLALAGNLEEARAINERLMPLHKGFFVEANPIPVKWAAHQMKLIDDGTLRLFPLLVKLWPGVPPHAMPGL